jgi:phage terminase small subunit
MKKITKAQRNFVNYFIEQDFKNATEAYRRAYPKVSYESARVIASKLLTNINIQKLISETLAEILEKDKIPLEKRLFDYWMKRAFYDITEIISINGEMKLTDTELRERGLAVCIDSINKKINTQGEEVITYKFADKDKATDMLQRYIQMIKEPVQESKIELSGTVGAMTLEERQKRIIALMKEAQVKTKKEK